MSSTMHCSAEAIYLLAGGYMSGSVEVDIKSCVISLIELYTHWLANPIHTLQLQYTLQSIVMLSDLFAVVRNLPIMYCTI